MPSEEAHREKAEHNEELAAYLASVAPKFAGWQIVVMFYTVLHYADAALAQLNLHPSNHTIRSQMVRTHLPAMFFDYHTLRDLSQQARYEASSFLAGDVDRIAASEFARVRAYLRARLNLPQ